jgi:hypothetical protein
MPDIRLFVIPYKDFLRNREAGARQAGPLQTSSANHMHGDEAKRQRDIFASLAYLQEHLRVKYK